MMKLRDGPEKWPKGYSTPCRKPSNESVTFEQGQPTKFVEQTSDKYCMAVIFFDKTSSTTLDSFELLDIFGYMDPTLQRYTPSGDELRTDKQDFSFLRTTICITPNKVKSLHCVPKKVAPQNMSKFLLKNRTLFSYHLTA